MRGILLAGGTGSRLWPLTKATSKQLMPVFDKPLVYYPLSTLIMAGLREILMITTPRDQRHFRELLGNGEQLGLRIEYAMQESPGGIAEAFLIAEEFLAGDCAALILGDNIFYGMGLGRQLRGFGGHVGAHVFAYPVSDPSAYGVVEFDATGQVIAIEEKPERPRSRYIVPGLYFYDDQIVNIARKLERSARNELEITDVNNAYLREGMLSVTVLERGTAWLDVGTFDSLVEAAEFVRVIQRRQGVKIGCVEEVAWRCGLIDDSQLRSLAEPLYPSGYSHYLLGLLERK